MMLESCLGESHLEFARFLNGSATRRLAIKKPMKSHTSRDEFFIFIFSFFRIWFSP